MPLNFFSPHHGYLSDRTVKAQHNEFQQMVKALHQVDIDRDAAASAGIDLRMHLASEFDLASREPK